MNLTAHSSRPKDRGIVLHHHVKGRTDESERRAIEFEQRIHIRPISYSQIHKRRTVVLQHLVDLADDLRCARRRGAVLFRLIHRCNSSCCYVSALCSGNTDGSAAQFSFFQITVSFGNAAQWILVLDRLDPSKTSQFHDFTEIYCASIHAGGELSSPGDVEQSEMNFAHGGTNERYPPESSQRGNSQF